jgi:hypothetical protein
MGRPLVYRPTPRLLQLLGAEMLEEARRTITRPTKSICDATISQVEWDSRERSRDHEGEP